MLYLDLIPDELLEIITLYVEKVTILYGFSNRFRKILDNSFFWKNKIALEFPLLQEGIIPESVYSNTDIDSRIYNYIVIKTNYNKAIKDLIYPSTQIYLNDEILNLINSLRINGGAHIANILPKTYLEIIFPRARDEDFMYVIGVTGAHRLGLGLKSNPLNVLFSIYTVDKFI